ncbi:TIGR00266 family protein [filamentous cyanobacterium CCP5]|nr:TIGR00266 family protein [filamentous cyanobacterium CCP5]
MHYEIRHKPAFSTAFITLNPGEAITAEAGAMASMDSHLSMTTQFSGNLIEALLKKFLGGESFFVNVFRNSTSQAAEVVLTQGTVGDMEVVELKAGESLCFQPGAYVAHMGKVNIGVQWAGFTSLLAGEGLFKLRLIGPGLVFFGAYGGISEHRVNGEFVVDNSHLVAYSPDIKMNIRLSGGLLGSVTSGEGLINRLQGNGKIYLQTRSLDGLVRFLRPKIIKLK